MIDQAVLKKSHNAQRAPTAVIRSCVVETCDQFLIPVLRNVVARWSLQVGVGSFIGVIRSFYYSILTCMLNISDGLVGGQGRHSLESFS